VDEEEEALLAVVASGAALGADAAKVVASEDVDEEVDVESMDETEAVPVTSRGAGLRPPAPSSVDPMGIPTRPTGAPAAMPVGDEADAVGEARLGPAVQVPDVVPVVPPSKTVANPVGVEVVPVVEAAPVAGAADPFVAVAALGSALLLLPNSWSSRRPLPSDQFAPRRKSHRRLSASKRIIACASEGPSS